MKLNKIKIIRLPGISREFAITQIGKGLNLIFGPNGSGKTSISRLIKTALWNQSKSISNTDASLEWENSNNIFNTDIFNTVLWQNSKGLPKPVVPDENVSSCYHISLSEMFDSQNKTEEDIARKIYIAMSGGYDFNAAKEKNNFTRNALKKEISNLEELLNKKRVLEQTEHELAEQQDLIEQLYIEKDEAVQAKKELAEIAQLEELKLLEQKLKSIQEKLNSYPEIFSKLKGDELKLIKSYKDEISAFKNKIDKTGQTVNDINNKINQIILPENIPDKNEIDETYRKLTKLRTDKALENDVKRELQSTDKKLNFIAADLKKYNIDLTDNYDYLNPENIKALFNLYNKINSYSNEIDFARIRVKNINIDLDDCLAKEAAFENTDNLNQDIISLQSWLKSTHNTDRKKKLTSIISTFLLIVFAAASFVFIYALPLATLFLGFLLFNLLTYSADSKNRQPIGKQIIDDVERILNVKELTVETVSNKLLELLLLKTNHENNKTLQSNLKYKLKELNITISDNEEKINNEITKVKNENPLFYKVNYLIASLELSDLLNVIENYREEYYKKIELEEKLRQITTACNSNAFDIHEFLDLNYDENYRIEHLETVYKKLTDSIQSYCSLEQKLKSTCERVKEYKDDLTKITQKKNDLLLYLNLNNDEYLEYNLLNHIERLPEFKKLKREEDSLKYNLNAKEKSKSLFDKYDYENLEEQKLALKQKAESYDEIILKVQDIQTKIEVAQKEKKLTECNAAINVEKHKLEKETEVLLRKLASLYVLNRAEKEYEANNKPKILKDAIELFNKFTSYRYSLIMENDTSKKIFRVFDNNSKILHSLDELSDGTKIQLFIAVRLAFIKSIEKSYSSLPLFFDETLSITDAKRFKEIATAIFQASDEDDRQIFYLTSDWNDVLKFQEVAEENNLKKPHVIDLTKLREIPSSSSSFKYKPLISKASTPHPGSYKNPDDYAGALHVNQFDKSDKNSEMHIFYILSDKLDILYKLITEVGVTKIGECRYLLENNKDICSKILGEKETDILELRMYVFEKYKKEWFKGRFKSFNDISQLSQLKLSDKLMNAIKTVLDGNNYKSENLINILKENTDNRLKGFAKNTKRKIVDFLYDNDYASKEEKLEPYQIKLNILSSFEKTGDFKEKPIKIKSDSIDFIAKLFVE